MPRASRRAMRPVRARRCRCRSAASRTGCRSPARARVLKLTDGRFTLTGPMGAGNPGNLGPCALIDIEGVRVMVVSHKMQALDQAILRHVGVEPSECPILALKSSVHFRADFAPIAEHDHRRHRAGPGGGRSGDPEFPLRAPRRAAAAAGRLKQEARIPAEAQRRREDLTRFARSADDPSLRLCVSASLRLCASAVKSFLAFRPGHLPVAMS